MMPQGPHYQIETMFGGWTRIDMLLALYDRATASVQGAEMAKDAGNDAQFAEKFMDAQKCILAIHGGLKPDEFEIAFDIARLLHFVLTRLSEHNFAEAAHFLEKLRGSFEAIRDQATELEKAGKIPPLELSSGLDAMA
jgi:flagellar protein FliS